MKLHELSLNLFSVRTLLAFKGFVFTFWSPDSTEGTERPRWNLKSLETGLRQTATGFVLTYLLWEKFLSHALETSLAQESDTDLFSWVWLNCGWVKGLLDWMTQWGRGLAVSYKYVNIISQSRRVTLDIYVAFFLVSMLFFLPNFMKEKKKQSQFSEASLCVSSFSSHDIWSFFYWTQIWY